MTNHIHIEDANPLDIERLRRAYQNAKCSGDLSTKNGSVLITAQGNLVDAFNDVPDGVLVNDERRQRPLRYEVTAHAEQRAILGAARKGYITQGATLYVIWYACNRCALDIIDSGVQRVVGHADFFGRNPCFDLTLAFEMLGEAGVRCDLIKGRLDVLGFVNGELVEL